MLKAVLCILACFVSGAQAAIGTTCKTDSDCASTECCQIPNPPLAQYGISTTPLSLRTGTCERLLYQGEWCDLNKIRIGYCGCRVGTTCVSSDAFTVGKRGQMEAAEALGIKREYFYESRCQ